MVEESEIRFNQKSYNLSTCPIKKRPVMLAEEPKSPEVRDEIIVVDDIPEPENLSTKPEDLSKTADKNKWCPTSNCTGFFPLEPSKLTSGPRSPLKPEESGLPPYYQDPLYTARYAVRDTTPSIGTAPYPVAKRGRVEVIQHESISAPSRLSPSLSQYIATKTALNASVKSQLDQMPYAPSAWSLFPPPGPSYYPYSGVFNPEVHFPQYPVPGFPASSPENAALISQSHTTALTCSTVVRSHYPQWPASPDHGGLSPTSSLGSSSLRSPPPNMAEDLSSPGSESGRSSAGSTSAGSSIVTQKQNKIPKAPSSPTSTRSNSSNPASRYNCVHCSKSYSTHSGLSKHEQFHCTKAKGQVRKSFNCKDCNKPYVSLGALKMHIRTHTLPCRCSLCGKAFSRPWLLQGHIRTHTGEKPFCCQHCNRAFADRSNLRAHLQTHSDVKKYSCDSCSKTFSRMSLLTKHQEGGCPGASTSVGYSC